MQDSEGTNGGQSQTHPAQTQIASWAHLAGFLAIMAGVCAMGFAAQHTGAGDSIAPAGGGQLATHSQAIRVYLTVGLMDWALLYYCWAGVHRRGGNLATLSGGRWRSWKAVAVDLAITLPFWVLWEAVAYGMHWIVGPGNAKTVDSLLPRSLIEILLWIAVSATAGICEEMAFRGYLQRQCLALGGGTVVAVAAQGAVFGVAHAYQGWKQVVVITALGVLYGAMAAWRKSLGVNILAHAWGDVWEGWLKFIVWR